MLTGRHEVSENLINYLLHIRTAADAKAMRQCKHQPLLHLQQCSGCSTAAYLLMLFICIYFCISSS